MMRSRRNRKNIFQIMYEIVRDILIAFFFLFILVVVVQRVSNNNFAIGGFRVFTVVSNSMVPRYTIGDILIVQTEEADKIKKGDNLCYLGSEGEYADKVITHEVFSTRKEDGVNYFVTKGLANLDVDPEISETQVYGVVRYKTYVFSFISRIANNKYGFFALVFIPLAFFVLIEMKDLIFEVNDHMNTRARRMMRR